jgi:hypothetical protein
MAMAMALALATALALAMVMGKAGAGIGSDRTPIVSAFCLGTRTKENSPVTGWAGGGGAISTSEVQNYILRIHLPSTIYFTRTYTPYDPLSSRW